jgi:exoribonuclease-2
VVQAYTLQEGRLCPALSLYATFDEATLALTHTETRIERVHIAANLRHDQLDALITEDWLTSLPEASGNPPAPLPDALQQLEHAQQQMAFLFRLARQLKQQREIARGKPELFNRPDYNFRLERPDTATAGDVPRGDETVVISTRARGAPLDLIVAEAMILANSTWGQWLADCGVPGIYRSQHSMAPGMKVRMGTKALPHAGMGVKCYAWSTSPLRRYVDLVNQWQIIACVRHGTTAALAAPFKPKDADLFSIISSFDAAYSAYNAYQSGMERYWTLKYLEQHGVGEITGAVIKEGLVRADTLPLVLGVMGTNGMPRGTHLRVRLGHIDLMGLEVSGTVLEVLTPQPSGTDPAAESNTADNSPDLDGEDDDITTGGLTLALDVNDASPADTPANAAAGA